MKPDWYFDSRFALQAFKIKPGEYVACGEERLLVAVVGSCVAVCIFDPESRVGGMSQFMVPKLGGAGLMAQSGSERGRALLDGFVAQLQTLGAGRERLQAKIFGGGNILNAMGAKNAGLNSALFVQEYLAAAGIPVVAKSMLGLYPRKVYFFPATGEVLVKRLKALNNETIVQREEEFANGLLYGGTCGAERKPAN